MSEEVKTEEGQENAEAKSGGSKLIMIIAIALVLIGGAGAAAYFLVFSGNGEAEAATEAVAEEPKEEKAEAADPNAPVEIGAYFYEVPQMLVNLSSVGSMNRYLKLKVNLEVATEADLATLERLMPRIVDDFQLYLRQLRVEDLNGRAGIYRLKEALLLRANQSARPLEIKDVLFKEILVQ